MEASKKREANIKKELRLVILKNIENFSPKVYHSQTLSFKSDFKMNNNQKNLILDREAQL
jgi:hypothetical protein